MITFIDDLKKKITKRCKDVARNLPERASEQ